MDNNLLYISIGCPKLIVRSELIFLLGKENGNSANIRLPLIIPKSLSRSPFLFPIEIPTWYIQLLIVLRQYKNYFQQVAVNRKSQHAWK